MFSMPPKNQILFHRLKLLWQRLVPLHQYVLKLTLAVSCLLLMCTAAPEKAHAFTIYNKTSPGIEFKARVLEGDFEKDVKAGQNESCHWSNTDCNPSGQRGEMLTVKMEIDNFRCDLKMPAGGYALMRSWGRPQIGLPPGTICESFDWNHKLIDRSPYDVMGKRSVHFLATADPQYYHDENSASVEDANVVTDYTLLRMKQRQQTDESVRGILVAGDLTQNTREKEWERYQKRFQDIPHYLFDGLGNHDYHDAPDFLGINCRILSSNCTDHSMIKDGVAKRQRNTRLTNAQGPHYSWDWQDVHFVQLNLMPSNTASPTKPEMDPYNSLDFLKRDLEKYVGRTDRPVVIIQHYGFDPFSTVQAEQTTDRQAWWTDEQRKAFWDTIASYPVKAIFTGHSHPAPNGNWIHPWQRPTGSTTGPDQIPTFTAGSAHKGAYLDVALDNEKMVVSRMDATTGLEVGRQVIPLGPYQL